MQSFLARATGLLWKYTQNQVYLLSGAASIDEKLLKSAHPSSDLSLLDVAPSKLAQFSVDVAAAGVVSHPGAVSMATGTESPSKLLLPCHTKRKNSNNVHRMTKDSWLAQMVLPQKIEKNIC